MHFIVFFFKEKYYINCVHNRIFPKIWGGAKCITVPPPSKIWGAMAPPVADPMRRRWLPVARTWQIFCRRLAERWISVQNWPSRTFASFAKGSRPRPLSTSPMQCSVATKYSKKYLVRVLLNFFNKVFSTSTVRGVFQKYLVRVLNTL